MAFSNTNNASFDLVMTNLNNAIVNIQGATLKGLIMGVTQIHNETEHGDIKVPVDLGNLRHSWFVVTANGIQAGHTNNFIGDKAGLMAVAHGLALTEAIAEASKIAASGKIVIIFGYSANYALWVHENIGMHDPDNKYWKHKKWRPGSDAKWFEAAIQKKAPEIIKLITKTAKV